MLRIAAVALPIRQMLAAVAVGGMLVLLPLIASSAYAADLYPVFTDLNASGGLAWGETDIFNNTTGTLEWDEDASYQGNEILVGTMTGPSSSAGIGITVAASNGENGIDEDLNGNVDIPNTEPVNPAIAAVNAGGVIPGKLNNGNVLRASVWMRSDPNSPATGISGNPAADSMPQVEGILKIEAWKEALSVDGDFDGPGDADYGDRIWDQDQQGGAGSFADANADGVSGQWGAPVQVTLNTETWTQMVVEYVVDDDPADPGNTVAPWSIGLDDFTVADVEDVRAVFYVGDWSVRDYTDGGSWWMDNLLFEVFTDQAAADALDPAIANPAPVEGLPGDFDVDGDVDGNDFLVWQQDESPDPGALGDWKSNFGMTTSVVALSAVPEPSTALLTIFSLLCLGRRATRHRR